MRDGREPLDVARAEDRVPECERAACLEPGEIGRREHPEHARAGVDDHDVVGARSEHLDDGVDGDPVGRHLDGRLHDPRHRVLGRGAFGDHALTEHGVGQDREVEAVADEERGGVVLAHDLSAAPDRGAALAEERRPVDQIGDPDRSQLGQGMDHVARLDEPAAERPREVRRAGRVGEDGERLLARDQEADGLLARPHRECRREAGQERGLPEGLAGPEDVDHLALVQELDGTAPDHEQVLRRRAVLNQDRFAGLVRLLHGACCDRGQLAGGERVERGEPAEERGGVVCVHGLHCSPPIPVAPALVMIVSFWELPIRSVHTRKEA